MLKPPLPPPLPVSQGPRGGDGIPKTPATLRWASTRGRGRDGGAAHQVSSLVPNRTVVEMRKVPMAVRFAGLRDLMERGR